MSMHGHTLPKKVYMPWLTNYCAELDMSLELDSKQANYYQSQIGVLHWIIELGQVDIQTEVSMLASQMALPQEGHLDAIFRVFSYLRTKHNSQLVLNLRYPEINHSDFPDNDWTLMYGNVTEAIPPNAPTLHGKEVNLHLYVDSDHAGDKYTCQSGTGFLIFLNSTLIMWKSKKQPTIETSVFGAEFMAMKHGMETLQGLRYKFRMMGVPISGPSYIYGDNISIIHNMECLESTLKKKSNEICYHAIHESVAMGESRTGHVVTAENPADLATKIITS